MTSSKRDRGEQIERFKEAARRVGANEDEAAFDDALRRIARQKPKIPAEHQTQKAQRSKKR